eukprot:comp11992_c0_seq1/m.6685 comp11992_c0_seq1/g.6685  ORF comp11992_c0_seq1/g.6685 comp11992_c0_seq1/m.6685 type:complete len:112 (-) comp11992_c0_seq1:221-556(-)
MSAQGAALQGYNNDLVRGIEQLRAKRHKVQEEIDRHEQEKNVLEKELASLTARLAEVDGKLAEKRARLQQYDGTIAEAEHAYIKILESSQALLELLKRSSARLQDPRPDGA